MKEKKVLNSKGIYIKLMEIGRRTGCHQRSDRSFYYHNYQFPVCARCTGVLIGYMVTIPIYVVFDVSYIHCLSFVIIMLVDWLLQRFKISESTNIRRVVTGTFGGFGVFGFQLCIVEEIIYQLKL